MRTYHRRYHERARGVAVNELDIHAWILWVIFTLGITVFITRSWWCKVIRTFVLIRFRSPSLFCGGCVGFWIGLATYNWFPLEYVPYHVDYLASALAGMLLGYAFGAGDYEGAVQSAEYLRKLDREAGK